MLYLCWQNDNTVLGVATSEEEAQKMCSEYADAYMPIQENEAQRERVDSTSLCTYNTPEGFLSFNETFKKYSFFKKNN